MCGRRTHADRRKEGAAEGRARADNGMEIDQGNHGPQAGLAPAEAWMGGVEMCPGRIEMAAVAGQPAERKVLVTAQGPAYEFIRTLKDCIYGKVKHVVAVDEAPGGGWVRREPLGQQQYALKIIRRDMLPGGAMHRRLAENPIQELRVQQRLSDPGHDNVVSVAQVAFDDRYIFAVLPFANGGELFGVVERHGAFPQPTCRHFFRQVVRGLQYLGQKNVCHRDMSLENVMLHDEAAAAAADGGGGGGELNLAATKALIIDFGLCIAPVQLLDDGSVALHGPLPPCGKPNYISPEIYSRQQFHPFKIDVWALGVMLFIMSTGAPPFETPTLVDPRFKIIAEGRLHYLLQQWGFHGTGRDTDLPDEAVQLMQLCLQVRPEHRPTCEQILAHPYLAQ